MSVSLYPMQLTPVCRATIWGGNKMRDCFSFQTKLDNIAEAWMMSAREDNPGFVCNGDYMGTALHTLLKEYPELLYTDAKADVCPLLIKFIDARDKLSVQVHPDDAYAQEKGVGRGKTEMWIVLEASSGAEIIFGTSHDFTKEEFRSAIASGNLDELMHHVPVKAGDVFYIPAGLVHAIGAGVLLAEVQQNCDTTYRVFDYNRRQADGSLRALHIDDAVACARHYTAEEIDSLQFENGDRTALADGRYFHVERYTFADIKRFTVGNGFVSVLGCAGKGVLLMPDGSSYPLPAGSSYFLPAGLGSYSVASADGSPVTVILSRT